MGFCRATASRFGDSTSFLRRKFLESLIVRVFGPPKAETLLGAGGRRGFLCKQEAAGLIRGLQKRTEAVNEGMTNMISFMTRFLSNQVANLCLSS